MSLNISKKLKSNHKSKISIYMKNLLSKTITLSFNDIGNNITELITEKIIDTFSGICIEEGFVKPNSINLVEYSAGQIRGNIVVFIVNFECLICRPVAGLKFNCVVKNITKAGIRAEYIDNPTPVIVFIAKDHHYDMDEFSKIKEDDIIRVRVIGIRFELNDKYISVIADFLSKNRKQNKKSNRLITKV